MLSSSSEPCAHWLQQFSSVQIPVLRVTRDALASWQAVPDRVSANALADVILRDPLMTLRLLTFVTQRLGSRLKTPVETVTAGLVLVGIEPFFREFAGLPVLEERLAAQPGALAGALQAIERSHRAACFAAAFAVHRLDEDAEVLHQAALLDNFAGLLLWCEAPEQALEMAARQQADPGLRSAEVQQAVLGVEVAELERGLMEAWGLPPFLRSMTDPKLAVHPGPHSVMLAVRIARHSQAGWDNPALPDDFTELGVLLNLAPVAAEQLVRLADA